MSKAYQQDATFRITNINWLRLYRVPAKKGLIPAGWVMKFDNFRLTDAIQYAKDEAKREQQAMIDKHAALIEEIKTLDVYKTSTSITEDNYLEAKAAIEAMRAKVNAVPAEELKVLTDAKAIKPLEQAEKTLADYEEDVETEKKTLEENKEFLGEIDKLAADYATITKDNLEAATAAAAAVREKYEALKKSVRNLLERKGYLAKLEAVEEAIENYKPADENNNTVTPPTTKGGCKGALTVGAGAMMLLAAAWVSIAARKKED
jgi:tetratricopeptide (TPR) repeat protein